LESYPEWPNLAAMMLGRAREWGARPMLRYWTDSAWAGTSWEEFALRAARLARGLRTEAGIQPGDRVLLCSENRPELLIAEVALMAFGAVPVPAYTTHLPADHAHLIQDCAPRAAVVSTPALASRVAQGARLAGASVRLFGVEAGAGESFAALETEPAEHAAQPGALLAEAERIPPGQLGCVIYTSGTGGLPRGVMLPHRAMLANLRGGFELMRPLRLRDEVHLSFLPWSHAFEHTIGLYFLLSIGTEIACSRGAEHLASDMQAVRPTIMTVVPRVLEVIKERILAGVARGSALQRRVFLQALAAGRRRLDGKTTLADRLLDPLYGRTVRGGVRDRFGGRLRVVMSGGARLEPDVERFYQALGMLVMQGYGQTEAGPAISANTLGALRIGTVGRPLEGVELRIADDGEVLVRGRCVMDGYWGHPDATTEVLRDGWLHTGDVGQLDADGFLTITDRKRDLIVLAGGENVSPARVEGALCAEDAIAQAVVAGDGQSGLRALLVPAADADEGAVSKAVARANAKLAPYERVRRHKLVPQFTLENGLLTPSHKVRRALVLRTHAEG
jgi:long-chain acyl-CoA synthetase